MRILLYTYRVDRAVTTARYLNPIPTKGGIPGIDMTF